MKWLDFQLTAPKVLTAGFLFNLMGQCVNAAYTSSTNSSTPCEPCPDDCCLQGSTCNTHTNEQEGSSYKTCSGGADMGLVIAIAVIGGVALIGGISYCVYNHRNKAAQQARTNEGLNIHLTNPVVGDNSL